MALPQTRAALGIFGPTIDTALATLRDAQRLTDDEMIACFTQLCACTAEEMKWKYAVQCGAYEAVVSVMRSRASSAAVQAAACHWLVRFGTTRDAAATASAEARSTHALSLRGNSYFNKRVAHAARAGAFAAITAAMRLHSSALEVLINGCSALTSLMLYKNNKRAAFDAGTLGALLCALRMDENSDAVVAIRSSLLSAAACQCLATMVVGCAEYAAAAARADVFDALFGAMRAHPMDALVQSSACKALAEISFVQLQPDAAAAAARGVALIVAALVTHDEDPNMSVGVGIKALAHILVDNSEAQARAAEAGGIELIVNYMRNSEIAVAHHEWLQEKHFQFCCEALAAWANSPDIPAVYHAYRAKCVAAGAIEAVVDIMRARHTEASVCTDGCDVLESVMTNSSANTQEHYSRAGNAIDVVLLALRTHAADVEVQRSCIKCLETLCNTTAGSPNHHLRIVAGWPDLVQAMQRHFNRDDASEIQVIGTLLLSSSMLLAGWDDANAKAVGVARLVSLGALEAVSRALLKHHTDCMMLMPGPLLLLNICTAGEWNGNGSQSDFWPSNARAALQRYGARAARAGTSGALRAAVKSINEHGELRSDDVYATIAARAIKLADELDALPLRACDGCGATDAELKRCSRCLSARFCSAACQRLAWGTHRLVCRAPAATTADAAPTSG